MKEIYTFAKHNFLIEHEFAYFAMFAKAYQSNDETNLIKISSYKEDCVRWNKEHHLENKFPLDYIETLVIHSKIASILANDNIFICHGSTIIVDNQKAFIFTANSGVGKSTHVNILKKLYGDRINYINDDKPFIELVDNQLIMYGSPWDGKEHRSSNINAPLKGIFFLSRGKENEVKPMNKGEAMMKLISQIHIPSGENKAKKGSELLKFMVENVPLYNLKVNMDDDAGKTSMKIMGDK